MMHCYGYYRVRTRARTLIERDAAGADDSHDPEIACPLAVHGFSACWSWPSA